MKAQLSNGDNTVQNQHFESKTDFELSLGVVFFPSVEARDEGGGVAVGPLNKNYGRKGEGGGGEGVQ